MSRNATVESFFECLNVLFVNVQNNLKEIEGLSADQRTALRNQWASNPESDDDCDDEEYKPSHEINDADDDSVISISDDDEPTTRKRSYTNPNGVAAALQTVRMGCGILGFYGLIGTD